MNRMDDLLWGAFCVLGVFLIALVIGDLIAVVIADLGR